MAGEVGDKRNPLRMCGRPISPLLGVILPLTACTEGGPPETGGTRTSVPFAAATSREANADSAQPAPEAQRSPIPLTTSDVTDPRDVSPFRFAPADSRILVVSPISEAGGVPAQLVLTWARGGDGSLPEEIGLLLWQHAGGLQAPWKVVYVIHDLTGSGIFRAGSPGRLRRARADIGLLSRIGMDIGDVTGDGHGDVLVFEEGSGTAGCSLFRVLANTGRTVEQIYFEEACETSMAITENGLLKVDEATYPKGCKNIHGCGRRFRLLRWNGAGWDELEGR
jgi:hypothetical protein